MALLEESNKTNTSSPVIGAIFSAEGVTLIWQDSMVLYREPERRWEDADPSSCTAAVMELARSVHRSVFGVVYLYTALPLLASSPAGLVQFKMVAMRWEKPICAPLRLAKVSPTLHLKRF